LLGVILSLACAVVLSILAIWSGSTSTWVASFHALGAMGIWILSLVQLHQQRLLEEERLEVAELERQRQEKLGGAQSIFEEEELDQMEAFQMGRRLRAIERGLVPVVALLIAGWYILAGLSIFPWVWQFPPIRDNFGQPVLHTTVLLFFTGAIAFVCFMMSRYALGMSRLNNWSLLRAGANALFGTSIICLAIAIALLFSIAGIHGVEETLTRVVGIALIVLAIETITLFIFEFYRPRTPGQEQRPFYDSRLLGMFSEPGGIIDSVSRAIDYQFGFKVSETWFYKLLGRAIMPLIFVQILIILALTCITVVPQGHQGVVERFGKRPETTLEPGIHLTAFWPVDRATIIPVDRIRRMELGFDVEAEARARQQETHRHEGAILWTKSHRKVEYKLVVADRTASANAKVPVNLLNLGMAVQWRVKSDPAAVIRYHMQSQETEAIIRSLAYRALTEYAAQSDILDLMGSGGIDAAEMLHDRVQAMCDASGSDGKGLGVEIVYVGIGGIHPPMDEDVAKTYEEVVSAYEQRSAMIKAAEGEAIETCVGAAGPEWRAVYEAIVAEDEDAEANGEPGADAEELPTDRVQRMLTAVAGGQARAIVAAAQEVAYDRIFGERAASERYRMELAAYESAPDVYSLRLYLAMIKRALADIRKFVIVLDEPERVIYTLDLKPPQPFEALAAEQAVAEQQQQ